jgi:hypothetical protein
MMENHRGNRPRSIIITKANCRQDLVIVLASFRFIQPRVRPHAVG